MAVSYNYKKGIDIPAWQWLAPFPSGNSYNGTSRVYDGVRYLYWVVQSGTTATTASTTQLWRYDTWSNSWQYLATATNGNQGMDIEIDTIRNCLYLLIGASTTTWQVFNLNTTAITVAGVSCNPWTLTTMAPVLPAAAPLGSTFNQPSDDQIPSPVDSGTADVSGQTTTTVIATAATASFGSGMVGLQLRVISGAQSGQRRTISAVSAPNSVTVTPALPAALVAGDTYVIEQVEDVATGGSTTTLVDSTSNWITNQYANLDVIITSGTGVGQRRRIASNTATTLTLAAAVTGNNRTGAFTTAPISGSGYKIVPSSDFLYYQVGGSTAMHKIDLGQTTGAAWAAQATLPGATGGGANTFYPSAYAPYSLIAFRGAGTPNVYQYTMGTNTWATITTFAGAETFSTGASATMVLGKRKLMIQKESTTRLYILDLLTGIYEPAGTTPYAAPAAYDGKRATVVNTVDGAQFFYIMRAGGQEFFRVPLEWL